jgi:serine/threonine protein kinase
MHRHRIIHRDLKAENILSHNGVYKIADLGFSKQMVSPED